MLYARAFHRTMRDARLSQGARLLLIILKSYADAQGHCHPSVATLMADMGASRATVFRLLDELEKWRILTRAVRKKGGKHHAKGSQKKNTLGVSKEEHEEEPLKNDTPPSDRLQESPTVIPFPNIKPVNYRKK
jgi:hypothetical protein